VLYEAATLDEKWPQAIAYDPVPWKRTMDMGPRFRPLDYWDRAEGSRPGPPKAPYPVP
jgi:hypothetical protein